MFFEEGKQFLVVRFPRMEYEGGIRFEQIRRLQIVIHGLGPLSLSCYSSASEGLVVRLDRRTIRFEQMVFSGKDVPVVVVTFTVPAYLAEQR
ncbi:hypothetical protein C480_07222 [Natrialba aegyptia DSM 13077]|uniref:Uncharacterized protein n=1 Tax=Natrialba aegyptia DSM 13077 TaxID=1227491 RepID=M0BAV9_9EURY|nr:hypothetical protein C480_07222 [Natrialba aegyptia DSM 13077]